VLTLFGKYIGTVKEAGFWFANPFAVKKRISLRVRNFETAKLKVNDAHSNPIEIAAIVVWKVIETAEAMFEVDNYESTCGCRASRRCARWPRAIPYDAHDAGAVALSTHTAEGVEGPGRGSARAAGQGGRRVHRVAHQPPGATRPKSPRRMLQPAAGERHRRGTLQDRGGAVGNGRECRWNCCRRRASVQLDEERKAAMVSNLLVVLCGERSAQPVLNTGTLYS
jgi:hypothetical protein